MVLLLRLLHGAAEASVSARAAQHYTNNNRTITIRSHAIDVQRQIVREEYLVEHNGTIGQVPAPGSLMGRQELPNPVTGKYLVEHNGTIGQVPAPGSLHVMGRPELPNPVTGKNDLFFARSMMFPKNPSQSVGERLVQ